MDVFCDTGISLPGNQQRNQLFIFLICKHISNPISFFHTQSITFERRWPLNEQLDLFLLNGAVEWPDMLSRYCEANRKLIHIVTWIYLCKVKAIHFSGKWQRHHQQTVKVFLKDIRKKLRTQPPFSGVILSTISRWGFCENWKVTILFPYDLPNNTRFKYCNCLERRKNNDQCEWNGRDHLISTGQIWLENRLIKTKQQQS